MSTSRVLLSLVAVVCLFASCKEIKRDFAPSAGASGTSTGGTASDEGGSAGDSAPGAGHGGTHGPGGAGGDAGAGAGGEAGAGVGCPDAERRCRGDVPEVCGADGTWEATQAGCAFGCLDGACRDCEEAVRACESGQAKSCIDGKWQYTVCDSQCEAGECVETCTENARQCDGLSRVQICMGGTFVDSVNCSGICAAGNCVGTCKPDEARCRPGSTTVPELCSSQGEWVAGSCSGTSSTCLEGACVACTPGATRCSSEGLVQQCSEFGSWGDQAPCAGSTPACVDGECRLCAPGSRRCSAGLPQQCNPMGTAWVAGAPCSGAKPACVAATGTCGTCVAGDRQCGNETTPQSCDANGRWVDQPQCATTAPVCLAGACTACQPGDRRCSGATPQLCGSSGQWQNQAACAGSTPTCLPDTGLCGCTPGATECLDSNTPELCSTLGTWVPQADCRGDTPVCMGGACQCSEGAQECISASTARVCRAGSWQPLDCPATTPACVAGKCVECTPGASRCSLGATHIVEICSTDGYWKESMQCADFCARAACANPAAEQGIIGCDGETGLLCKGTACCFAPKGTSYCQDLRAGCDTKTIPMECDGPSDCPREAPICCATATGIGCIATAAECSKVSGVYACDPEAPVCPQRTGCKRSSHNLFTCQ